MSMDEIYCLQAKRICAEVFGLEKIENLYRRLLISIIREAGCNKAGANVKMLATLCGYRPHPGSPDYDPEGYYKTSEEESDERALHEDDLYKECREEEGRLQ